MKQKGDPRSRWTHPTSFAILRGWVGSLARLFAAEFEGEQATPRGRAPGESGENPRLCEKRDGKQGIPRSRGASVRQGHLADPLCARCPPWPRSRCRAGRRPRCAAGCGGRAGHPPGCTWTWRAWRPRGGRAAPTARPAPPPRNLRPSPSASPGAGTRRRGALGKGGEGGGL